MSQTAANNVQAVPAGGPEWSAEAATETYRVRDWGAPFFRINERGHIDVLPLLGENLAIDLYDVVQDLRKRRIDLPCLIRFQDILRARVVQLHQAFAEAIADSGYGGRYVAVYPIKVNQLHEVMEEILEAGEPYGLGLECGSKAELIAALPHLESDTTPLVCNGYKDGDMLQLILAAQALGKNVIPVVEKVEEFERINALARSRDSRPRFGLRVRIAADGSGRWAESGGMGSKFGVSIPELLSIVNRIRADQMADALVLLHFHVGSQISDIKAVRNAVREIAQVYAELRKRGIGVRYLDVGGGLGVNYGSGFAGGADAINYSLQEYANSVVYSVLEVCHAESVPHPTIISESGRALTAHHSVLIVEVIGANSASAPHPQFEISEGDHDVARELHGTLTWLRRQQANGSPPRMASLLEAYHDAMEKREQADSLFSYGYLSIEQRALAQRLYQAVTHEIHEAVRRIGPDWLPPELEGLENRMVDQYLCDFSVFQSMMDHWAIGQRFPIVPIHRLDEPPTRRAVLVDLTCDSDGRVSRFISAEGDRRFLEVHELRDGEPYILGVFLMGAYQDIMGDMHNLFGRVSEAHVYADPEEPGNYYIEKTLNGASVEEILALVQYFPNDLHRRMQKIIQQKVREGAIRPRAGVDLLDQYSKFFRQYTYFSPGDGS